MILERFEPAHFVALDLQPAQQHMREYLTPQFIERLLCRGYAYTLTDCGQPMVCFGFHPWTDDRGVVWTYFDRSAGRHMVALVRYGMRFLSTLRGHVFAMVEEGFAQGSRFVEMLGFRCIGSLPQYGLAGRPHDIYLQVR